MHLLDRHPAAIRITAMLEAKLASLAVKKSRMIDYLRLKVDEEDWHGVSDAANDLREIEAQAKVVRGALEGVAG